MSRIEDVVPKLREYGRLLHGPLACPPNGVGSIPHEKLHTWKMFLQQDAALDDRGAPISEVRRYVFVDVIEQRVVPAIALWSAQRHDRRQD